MNGFLKLNWTNLKSAAVYGVMSAAASVAFVVGSDILRHGSVYGIDWHAELDKGGVAIVGIIVTFVSVIKNLLTDAEGKFLGVIEVIPDKSPAGN